MNIYELKEILLLGESYKIEFKESVDKSFVEEITAFANASGGRLFLGVADNGTIKGVDTGNSYRSRIQDTISQIKPSIRVDLEVIENVIVINVPEGRDKPYACSKGFFLRMGANSQKLERDDIIDFFQIEGKIRFDEIVQKEVEYKENLDFEAYNNFIGLSGISENILIENLLLNLDCIVSDKKDKTHFTNAGILFFSKTPITFLKHCSVVCALYKGSNKVTVLDKKELTGNIILNIEDAFLFLKKHLNIRYEIEGTRRNEILDIPETALREALINAVCHRDYFEKGAQVMIDIFEDRVVISNPGGLPKGLELKNFGKVSMTRNPIIASILLRTDYIEKMGTGINRIYSAMLNAKLPKPTFEFEGFFIVTLKRESFILKTQTLKGSDSKGRKKKTSLKNNKKNTPKTNLKVAKKTNLKTAKKTTLKIEKRILELLKHNPKISKSKIALELGNISESGVKYGLECLKNKEIIKHSGPKKGGYWEIIKQ